MQTFLTPKHKLVALGLAAGGLLMVALLKGASAATAARVVLGLASVAGLAFWYVRRRGGAPGGFKNAPRLSVVARAGLSQRSGVALVEVDGQAMLVVHGDGFAQVKPLRQRRVVRERATDKVAALRLASMGRRSVES